MTEENVLRFLYRLELTPLNFGSVFVYIIIYFLFNIVRYNNNLIRCIKIFNSRIFFWVFHLQIIYVLKNHNLHLLYLSVPFPHHFDISIIPYPCKKIWYENPFTKRARHTIKSFRVSIRTVIIRKCCIEYTTTTTLVLIYLFWFPFLSFFYYLHYFLTIMSTLSLALVTATYLNCLLTSLLGHIPMSKSFTNT